MATGKGLICKLGEHIPIEGADKIVQVNMFGETIITQKTNKPDTIGILFDMETCLSHEYASKNNMYRKPELNEDKTVTGYLEDDRRIRPIKLKGVKVSGLFMPIESLYLLGNISDIQNIKEGLEIDSINEFYICEKYISKATKKGMTQNKEGRVKQNLCPTFREHIDTDQWSRNTHKVQEKNTIIITEKLHGTSGRCGNLPVKVDNRNLFEKFMTFLTSFFNTDPETWSRYEKTEYQFVVGSRRVVKSIGGSREGYKEGVSGNDYYKTENIDLWTKVSKEHFEGKLRKGETVYFEIVGYTPSGELIMPSVSNKKLEKFLDKKEYKDFIDRYRDVTTFNYGCSNVGYLAPNYKVFVYRITMTNEDGDSIDYSWEQVKNRCEQLGVNYTPELDKGIAYIHDKTGEIYLRTESKISIEPDTLIQQYTNDYSKEFPSHIREGVCVRIENGGMTPIILKNKSFIFKVLEGIIKDNNSVDIEESN